MKSVRRIYSILSEILKVLFQASFKLRDQKKTITTIMFDRAFYMYIMIES